MRENKSNNHKTKKKIQESIRGMSMENNKTGFLQL